MTVAGIRDLLRASAEWITDVSDTPSMDGFFTKDNDDHDNVRNIGRDYPRIDPANAILSDLRGWDCYASST